MSGLLDQRRSRSDNQAPILFLHITHYYYNYYYYSHKNWYILSIDFSGMWLIYGVAQKEGC